MGMYSGIGSFAKKFQTGGEAQTNGSSTGSGAPTDNLDDVDNNSTQQGPLSREQFLDSLTTPAGGGQVNYNGKIITKAAAYDAYLTFFQAVQSGNVNITGVNVTGANVNASANVTRNTLPPYMSFDDAGNIVFSRDTTNRQFIEGLNMLGLLSAEHSEGKTDYDWLLEWFDAGSEGAESSWLAIHLLDPDRVLDFDKMYGADTDLTAQNQATLRRLNNIVNNASAAGGFFEPSQTFRNAYADPVTVGQNYGDGTGASTSAIRPVFIGQPPTGGTAQQPYYSASDVLVSSSEQPNLYDRFNPYPVGDFKYYRSKNDPYQSGVTTNYAYQAPGSGISTSNLDALGRGLVFEAEQADAVDSVVDDSVVGDAEVVDTTQGTGGTGITDTTSTTSTTDTSTNNTTPTDTFNNLLGSTTEQTTIPIRDAEGYIRTALFKDIDPYIYGKRGILQGQKVLEGSKRNLSTQEFMDVLAGQSGTGSYGGDLIYDPERGIIYSGISDRMGADQQQLFMNAVERARSNSAVPFLVDPSLLTDVEKIRTRHLYGGEGGTTSTRIGDTQYFVNDDGTITALDVKDIQYGYTPGFAEGGIVDVYDDGMVSMQTTGEGIESFLNPERSKATLRRNLAKLAPRPTAPVMQQGIMPMAR